MPMYSKECLETLRSKIDLIEVLSPYVQLKKAGATYKALCPFHQEKSPSFIVTPSDQHYHCFGCSAHGDAISFLMNHLKMSFTEAIEYLADKFQVPLEYSHSAGKDREDLRPLKALLTEVSKWYQFHLLHTDEGHAALYYLYKRGIDLDFISSFTIGFAPKDERLTMNFLREIKAKPEDLAKVGLLTKYNRPFFSNRITFPLMDTTGNVIGFSARKIDEDVFGGKYINTPETPLFKKSRVLFGLNYCRSRIAKEQKAIVVEGQMDALRLIHEGINFVVAGGGTAFGEDHAKELIRLGVTHVYLAFDGDDAGREAAVKVGQIFQCEGVEVSVLPFSKGMDPDTLVQQKGSAAFLDLLATPKPFLPFLVDYHKSKINIATPAGKNELARQCMNFIEKWKHAIMIHEGYKLLAELINVPEGALQKDKVVARRRPKPTLTINPQKVLEEDLLRWMILVGQTHRWVFDLFKENLSLEDFTDPSCTKILSHVLELISENETLDIMGLASRIEDMDDKVLDNLLSKKVNLERAKEGMEEALQKILDRAWMEKRSAIQKKIQSGRLSEDQAFALAKEFDMMKKNRPTVRGNA